MILIIAYGNSLRRDDGAGFVLASKLEALWSAKGKTVSLIEVHQLAPELSRDISEEAVSVVVFVDTRAAAPGPPDKCGPQVRVRRIYPAADASPSVGHNLDASVVLAYAKYLFGKEPPSWLITIPGFDFDHGEGLSEPARKAVLSSIDLLKDMDLPE